MVILNDDESMNTNLGEHTMHSRACLSELL